MRLVLSSRVWKKETNQVKGGVKGQVGGAGGTQEDECEARGHAVMRSVKNGPKSYKHKSPGGGGHMESHDPAIITIQHAAAINQWRRFPPELIYILEK